MTDFYDFGDEVDGVQPTRSFGSTQYHNEEVVPGVVLQNYTKRQPNDEGTYVLITTHTERIEKIKQPPTPEEIESQRRQDRIAMTIVGGLVVGFFGLMGYAIYKDEKALKPPSKD